MSRSRPVLTTSFRRRILLFNFFFYFSYTLIFFFYSLSCLFCRCILQPDPRGLGVYLGSASILTWKLRSDPPCCLLVRLRATLLPQQALFAARSTRTTPRTIARRAPATARSSSPRSVVGLAVSVQSLPEPANIACRQREAPVLRYVGEGHHAAVSHYA